MILLGRVGRENGGLRVYKNVDFEVDIPIFDACLISIPSPLFSGGLHYPDGVKASGPPFAPISFLDPSGS